MIIYGNEEQKQEVERVCKALSKKGYRYNLVNNFLNDGVVIEIQPNSQIEGELVIFDNGNWQKGVYLRNISLYESGKVSIMESLLKYGLYKITGELPLCI